MNPSPRPNSRQAIVDAAVVTLSRNAGASISEIALKAGVGRATLHRHFRSREELVNEIQAQCMDETEAAVRAGEEPGLSPRERLTRMLTAVIPLGDRFHFLSFEATTDERLKDRYRGELAWVRDLVEELKKAGEIGSDIPTSWALTQIDQIVWTAWLEVASGRLAAAHAPELALRTLLRGLQ